MVHYIEWIVLDDESVCQNLTLVEINGFNEIINYLLNDPALA